jgi:hypothetical protein
MGLCGGGSGFFLPGPDRGEEVRHVNALAAHLDHPWVFEHAPGRGAARWLFFETVDCQLECFKIGERIVGRSEERTSTR